nr:tctex1 domain-containing protein 2 [Cavia porcellus]
MSPFQTHPLFPTVSPSVLPVPEAAPQVLFNEGLQMCCPLSCLDVLSRFRTSFDGYFDFGAEPEVVGCQIWVALSPCDGLLAAGLGCPGSRRPGHGPPLASTSFTAGPSFAGVDGLLETEKNSEEPENTYILRPIFQQRFRPSVVKDCIHAVLKEELANAEYSAEETPQLTKHLSENIKDKLKEIGFDRYKMVVQVVIGEQRGEGVFMAARCFWDADTDNYTHDVFMNDSLFCVVAAFGCFYY